MHTPSTMRNAEAVATLSFDGSSLASAASSRSSLPPPLLGSTLYYFLSEKDADPQGFVQLENVVVTAIPERCAFEIAPSRGEGTVKSVKMEDPNRKT